MTVAGIEPAKHPVIIGLSTIGGGYGQGVSIAPPSSYMDIKCQDGNRTRVSLQVTAVRAGTRRLSS